MFLASCLKIVQGPDSIPAWRMSEVASSKTPRSITLILSHTLSSTRFPFFSSRSLSHSHTLRWGTVNGGDSTERRQLEKKEPCTAPVPSMSSSCPWLPSSVLDKKGAKSTNISLSSGATFSRARSSFVVMLQSEGEKKNSKRETQRFGLKIKYWYRYGQSGMGGKTGEVKEQKGSKGKHAKGWE